jgi:hypothetical protein
VVFILLLGMGAGGWIFYKRFLLVGKIRVAKTPEKELLTIEVATATPTGTGKASALAPSAPPADLVAVKNNGPQLQVKEEEQEPKVEPKAEPEPELEPEKLTPKQRRQLAKEEARRRWESQQAEERRQLMQMLSEKFAFAQMNEGETMTEMIGRARCDRLSSSSHSFHLARVATVDCSTYRKNDRSCGSHLLEPAWPQGNFRLSRRRSRWDNFC